MPELNPKEWPKYVYKRGTGREVGDDHFTAEAELVKNPDELKAIGGDAAWCDSPREAAKPVKVK